MRNKSQSLELGTQYMGCASVRAKGATGRTQRCSFLWPKRGRTAGHIEDVSRSPGYRYLHVILQYMKPSFVYKRLLF